MRFIFFLVLVVLLFGCGTNDELLQTQRTVSYLTVQIQNQREELSKRISELEKAVKDIEEKGLREKKEKEKESHQVINLMITLDALNEKIKILSGKLDELEHQLNIYWKETRDEFNAVKNVLTQKPPEQKKEEKSYEELYVEALASYQKGNYDESIRKFSDFLKNHSGTPLAPNAYFWLGESFMARKEYEKAILSFQEVIEKHPSSEVIIKAYLSQAEAFYLLGDKKSSSTALKRVIQLFPKSEEAKIAERKLKTLSAE
ncbi:MAG: tol-pal system protein YbgF [Deltaproteobacteria bacterium]|nr:tol-pal system protein YbgF [Deltaproteobacteria bacterium]